MSDKVLTVNGARNYALHPRAEHDYYATPPEATEALLRYEQFTNTILEPCCGGGHIARVLTNHGYNVLSYDLIDRGYGDTRNLFYLRDWTKDIVTNPPYKLGMETILHCLNITHPGCKIAMLLKLTFLETQARYQLFKQYPPKKLYVFSKRILCALNGDFEHNQISSAVAYAWYIWEKGYTGEPVINWIEPNY